MIKLITTDMDGTLLDENGYLPDGFMDILSLLNSKNIKFIVASGRPYYTLQTVFGPLSNSLSYICENGALVVDNNEIIYKNVMNTSQVKDIIETVKNTNGSVAALCTSNCAYVENCSEDYLNQLKKYYTTLKIVDNISDIIDNDILKVTICNLENSEESLEKIFKPKFADQLTVTSSGDVWIDITNKDVNKGVALKKFMDSHNISKEENMVFGDYYNDIEMLKLSDYSFVMENAPEDMKQHGKYIAESNTEHGVLRAIVEYAL